MDEQKTQAIARELSTKGIFIVGHARSGTSVLYNALNSSPDVFLLAEANFHQSIGESDFAAWYTAMHESFANLPAKGYRCPMIPGDGWASLFNLRTTYRHVGEKVAFRSRELGYDMVASYLFLQRWFLGSAYLCTLREPRQVLLSNREMFHVEDMRPYFVSYMECLAHEVNIYLTFDRTYFLVYEMIDRRTFEILGRHLEIELDEAYSEYDPARQSAQHEGDFGPLTPLLAIAEDWYARLRSFVDPETLRCPNRVGLRHFQSEMAETLAVVSTSRSKGGPA